MPRWRSINPFRLHPSTNSITRKYALSGVFEMSKTWTMLACCRNSDSRASSRNMLTNFWFFVRFGRMRLIATDFLKPSIDSATPRKTSAMPP